MGTVAPRKVVLLLVLMIASASLFLTSSAGTTRKFANWPTEKIGATTEGMTTSQDEEEAAVHHRMLKVKTNDYGTYDPAPAFVKPPFKLIPN
ncbi:hypothetical protein Taro_028882 [Colocasia esculenta]|uniref:Uncharacterized protein n=1 Tax=Colocasia esculenta TaxID=4460 RepID=A0A843VIE3_COLES|nr:hypothetical protein [Colocasia esculenta]